MAAITRCPQKIIQAWDFFALTMPFKHACKHALPFFAAPLAFSIFIFGTVIKQHNLAPTTLQHHTFALRWSCHIVHLVHHLRAHLPCVSRTTGRKKEHGGSRVRASEGCGGWHTLCVTSFEVQGINSFSRMPRCSSAPDLIILMTSRLPNFDMHSSRSFGFTSCTCTCAHN